MLKLIFVFVAAFISTSAAFAQAEEPQGQGVTYQCYADAHFSIHQRPTIWGEESETMQMAQNSAVSACSREYGWNSSCRVTSCMTSKGRR